MIERIRISNYRIFKDLDFKPTEGINVVVGDNEAGKSTLLEAIELALTGRFSGKWASDELNPFWFNQEAVEKFWEEHEANNSRLPPVILIEVYFKSDFPPLQKNRGRINSMQENCPGFTLRVELDPQYLEEFSTYINDPSCPNILPTEYYRICWMDFSGAIVSRRPKDLKISRVDSQSIRSRSAIDYHARQMLIDLIDEQKSAKISVAYRRLRHELTNDALEEINLKTMSMAGSAINRSLKLAMDQSSSSNWQNSVVPHVSEIPFNLIGQGAQSLVKTSLALESMATNANVLLIEEPENHLSHTSLFRMLDLIRNSMTHNGNQQIFVTTHSSFVLNKLGLNKLQLLHRGVTTSFRELSSDTNHYFELQPGFDTLRIVLARRLVILEGPSDELIFMRAYKDVTGREPYQDGIDIVTAGTSGGRVLELCALLDRSVAVLRDVDDATPEHWRSKVEEYLQEGKRSMFIGSPEHGRTLEPQILHANAERVAIFAEIIGRSGQNIDRLESYMIKNKTEWAWRVADSKEQINYPDYIQRAIEFVRP